MFCDAHFHLVQAFTAFPAPQNSAESMDSSAFADFELPFFSKNQQVKACTCAHSIPEYEKQKQLLLQIANSAFHSADIRSAFGMHPQQPALENALFLEQLLEKNEICAVGETGFDLFTDEFKVTLEKQKEVWQIQLELARKFSRPLVIHCRKAMNFIFADSRQLKKLPAVLFHSFPENPDAAFSILNHGINAFFSFGKQILNGNKKAIACVKSLPLQNLLLETDAPFQTLKGEKFTSPDEIKKVYEQAFYLRTSKNSPQEFSIFCQSLCRNFESLFG